MVRQLNDLGKEILREFHCSRFTVNPGGMKMYRDLRCHYYWSGIKQHVGDFFSTMSHVSAGLLEPLGVAEWK